jgi:type I restriction enzyme, S subunit
MCAGHRGRGTPRRKGVRPCHHYRVPHQREKPVSTAWPTVRLREVLRPISRPEKPAPGKAYRQLGVRLWGQGAYERESIDGASTRYAVLSRVEADDIVVNKIWARNGSVAVVQPELTGCFVSGEFPTFQPVPEKLISRWIHWLTKSQDFWAQCDDKSRGTSGKNRIKPEQFLRVEIPLPAVAEQQRIVAQIDELAAKIAEARLLREQAAQEAAALLTASRRAAILDCEAETVSLEDCCSAVIDNLHSNPRYSETGIPCVRSPDVGYGTLNLENALRTDEDEYRRRTVRGKPIEDDVVLVREGGGTGKCALVLTGQRFSLGQRVMMLRLNPERVIPHFFLHQMLCSLVQEEQINELCKGSASPHLNIATLRGFRMRIPRLAQQHRIVAYLDTLQTRVDVLKNLQARTTAELTGLLPSILDKAFNGGL